MTAPWFQNTPDMIVPVDSCILNFWLVEIPCYVIPCWTAWTMDRSEWCTYFLSQVTIRSRNVSPIQAGADVRQTATCCFFWPKFNISMTHRATLFWTVVFMNICFNTSNAVGCNITHCYSPVTQNPLYDAANVQVAYSCWLYMSMLYVREFCTASRKIFARIINTSMWQGLVSILCI
jgi:hypothetical protein